MNVRTAICSGQGEDSNDQPQVYGSAPYINKWLTCTSCKGKKDEYGNVGNGSCYACWPMGMKAPI